MEIWKYGLFYIRIFAWNSSVNSKITAFAFNSDFSVLGLVIQMQIVRNLAEIDGSL